jgi:O-antigen ligase
VTGQPAIKALIIYGLCIPLALFIGFQISDLAWATKESLRIMGAIFAVLLIPVMLKWHRPILYFCINASIVVFLLPGSPKLGLVMVAISLMFSILHRIMQPRATFLHAPELTRPVLAVVAVLVMTAMLRGGVGFNAFGGGTVGGSRYAMLLMGVLSFFAMTAEQIPAHKRNLYIGLFFLSGVTMLVGDFFSLMDPGGYLKYIYLFFPLYSVAATPEFSVGVTRLFGFTGMAVSIYHYLIGRYGIRGILLESRRWLQFLFIATIVITFLGGFRSVLIHISLLFLVMFCLEKLYRTRVVVPLALGGLLAITVVIIFLPKMPFVFQRSLAFLPVKIDPVAQMDADSSSEWRLQMWKAVWPDVPKYLLLGKGLSFPEADFLAITDRSIQRSPDQWLWAVITGDYHNGPLSMLLTFGIWGFAAFTWLQLAGLRAMIRNFRYGDPSLRIINGFLLTQFITHMIVFWFVAGCMYSDAVIFASLLGFSVSLNGGIARQSVQAAQPVKTAAPKPVPQRQNLPLRPGMAGAAPSVKAG